MKTLFRCILGSACLVLVSVSTVSASASPHAAGLNQETAQSQIKGESEAEGRDTRPAESRTSLGIALDKNG